MKLQTMRRTGAAAAAVLALSAGLAACGDDSDDNADDNGGDETSAPADPGGDETSSDDTSTEGTEGGDDASAGTFGEGCAQVPTDPNDPGSFNGMVQDAVGTAASNNPLLKTLVAAVGAAGLVDTLNDTSASYTVFAPYDGAFAELPKKTVNMLVNGAKGSPESPLGQILLHHVLGENDDPAAVVGEKDTANGDTLTVEGDPESGMTVSDGKTTANVLCGNIQTANATVYVIDQVLQGGTVK